MAVTLRSYAKINLGLAIGPVGPDGFHALATLYQTLAVHDLITVAVEPVRGAAEPAWVLSSNDRRVPLDGRNTVAKMLTLALGAAGREELAGRWQVRVRIEKRLPIQGGMGGGSANAAAALIGLERELARLGNAGAFGPERVRALSGAERLEMAAAVGSDVPLFLLGGAVLGLGRGEQVVPLADLEGGSASGAEPGLDTGSEDEVLRGLWTVVALPAVGVSTPSAFRAWDEQSSSLTTDAQTSRLMKLSRALASVYCAEHATGVFTPGSAARQAKGEDQAGSLIPTLVQTGILLNDFEQVVFRQHPLLEQIKRVLAGESPGHEALYCALSGSGSAVFGLYRDKAGAEAAEKRLNAAGVRSLVTRTLGRREYWAGMLADAAVEEAPDSD
jgi:4-diphosphocytidyl-2-C-methyl-D-erythritol kinase